MLQQSSMPGVGNAEHLLFMPLLFATGPGSELQRPLAVVVIGGLFTSTLYAWLEGRSEGQTQLADNDHIGEEHA